MKVIDLTHTIRPDISMFPGSAQPEITTVADYEQDFYRESLISVYSHTGTHMDAPAHIIPGSTTLDEMDPSSFAGAAVTVDCFGSNGGMITAEFLAKYEDILKKVDFILFYTGHSRYWNTKKYYEPYPFLSEDAARLIVSNSMKGVGIDTFSVDPMDPPSLAAHRILLSSGIVIIENLNNLDLLGDQIVDFYALPLKYDRSDGAPVRAIAVIR